MDLHGYLDRFYAQTAGRFGKAVVGYKLFPRQLPEDLLLEAVSRADVHVILLKRWNMLQAAVSYEIAMQTGQWNYTQREAFETIRVDPGKIEEFVFFYRHALARAGKAVRRTGKPVFSCSYERLFRRGTIRGMLDFLGESPAQFKNEQGRKLNSPERYRRIANIKEIDARYAGLHTGYVLDWWRMFPNSLRAVLRRLCSGSGKTKGRQAGS
jgi:hypothetical protein